MQSGDAGVDGEDSGAAPGNGERRGDPRYGTDADSVVLMLESRIETDGRVENLSLSGCRLGLARRVPVAAGMHVEVAFKLHREALRLAGEVQWFDGSRHLGIRFGEISERRRESLEAVIEELAAAELICVDLQQEQENSDGRASGKKQADLDAPVTGQEENMELATSAQETTHEERRHDRRQSIHSVAAIYPIEQGGKINAWIQNLSLGGCRLQLEGEASIEPQMRLEVGFFYEGLPFRVSGVLLGTYSAQEVGIQFVEVSERNQKRLEDLIKEIEQQGA